MALKKVIRIGDSTTHGGIVLQCLSMALYFTLSASNTLQPSAVNLAGLNFPPLGA